MISLVSTGSFAAEVFLQSARVRAITSLARFPSRTMRRIASRASARLGVSPASQRKLALALATMPANGWLISERTRLGHRPKRRTARGLENHFQRFEVMIGDPRGDRLSQVGTKSQHVLARELSDRQIGPRPQKRKDFLDVGPVKLQGSGTGLQSTIRNPK